MDEDADITWQLETQLAIRGLPILMHEQTTAHYCPIQVEWRTVGDTDDAPVPLLTTFLLSSERPRDPATGQQLAHLRHALHFRLLSLREKNGVFDFFDHLEQTADWDDTLVVDIQPGDGDSGPKAWVVWNSESLGALRDWNPTGAPLGDEDPTTGVWRAAVRVPPAARPILGEDARIELTVRGRA
jgi:hypothetical protein